MIGILCYHNYSLRWGEQMSFFSYSEKGKLDPERKDCQLHGWKGSKGIFADEK